MLLGMLAFHVSGIGQVEIQSMKEVGFEVKAASVINPWDPTDNRFRGPVATTLNPNNRLSSGCRFRV